MVSEARRYAINFDTAFEHSLNCAKKCFNVKNHEVSNGFGVISCVTGASLRSWGESVKITVRRISAVESEISVSSIARSQLIDWGKSRENINLFFRKFEATL